jgi:hypothetical protein
MKSLPRDDRESTTLKEMKMKKVIAVLLLVASGIAAASCPINQPYRCYTTITGKQVCGCF